MRRRTSDEEIDAIGSHPHPGEVWWCEGTATGLNDGGKTRPVLVLSIGLDAVRVIPLTSRKPEMGSPVAVSHRGGISWMTGTEVKSVPPQSLISSLGLWTGFTVWRRGSL